MYYRFLHLVLLAGLTVNGSHAAGLDSSFTTTVVTAKASPDVTISRPALTVNPTEYLAKIRPSLTSVNQQIIDLLLSYPRDGRHDYWWPKKGEGPAYDGATTDVIVNNRIVMKGEPEQRTFCCGLTLEVYYRLLASISPSQISAITDFDEFKKDWFCRQIDSPGPADAFVRTGLGKVINNPEEAQPGDFVQIWRTNKSGHSVIFINWLYGPRQERIGLQYWSTQKSTKGIGFNSEFFGNLPGAGLIDKDKISISRPEIKH